MQMAAEVADSGALLVRLPRTASSRGTVTYLKLLDRVKRDSIWGGWRFEGRLLRPGGFIPAAEIQEPGLLLECAGVLPGGWGHSRAPTLYLLWRWDRPAGRWRELARVASVGRDWTLDLGPIARREFEPPGPLLVDPEAAAGRLMAAFEQEIEALEFKARVLVLRAVQDRLAAGMAG